MAGFVSEGRWKALGLGATLSFCLLFLQLAVAIGSPARRDYGTGLSWPNSALSLCAQLDKDAGKAPTPHGHPHNNCLACALGQAVSSFDDIALTAKGAAPTVRGAILSARSRNCDAASLLAAGFATSWSSRAPPIFS